MGQEIVYCYRCQTRLMGSDFEKGKAFRVGAQVSCEDCVRGLFSSLPPAQIDAEIDRLKGNQVGTKKGISSTRVPAVRNSGPESTAKIKVAPAPESAKSKLPLILGALAVLAAVILAVVASSRGGPAPSRMAEDPAPDLARTPSTTPKPAPVPEMNASAFVELDRAIAARVESDDYSAAARDLEKARGRRSEPAWNAGIDERRARLDERARAALPGFLEPAIAAHHEGRADEVDRLRGFIAAFPALAAEFDRRIAATSTPAPSPTPSPTPKPAPKTPAAPKPSWEIGAYKKSWSEAMALRETAGARATLEKTAKGMKTADVKAEAALDLDLLKRAEPVRAEGLAALAKVTKDQKIKLEVRDDAMSLGSFEGTILVYDGMLIRLATETGTLDLPASELSEESIARFYAERPGHGAEDAKAAAVWCCLRGEGVGARRLDATLPPKYYDFGDRATAPSPDAESRRAFWAGFAEVGMNRSRGAGLERLSKLSAPRFKGFIDLLMEGAKDAYFSAPDLSSSGSLSMIEREKVGTILQSGADGGKTWVEAEYYALPDQIYRAWAYVGGCCQEVFSFSLQATGLKGIDPKTKQDTAYDPGEPAGLPVKLPYLPLKKIHSQHLGPKEPDRWEWIPLSLPKPEAAGLKKIRLLTDQKGFAVAHLVVSATRRGPPTPTEIKDLLKERPTAPRFILAPGPATGKPTRTAYHGGAGGAEFEELAPAGAVLVGLKYSAKAAGGKMKFLQAIYRLGDQTTRGGNHGQPDTSAELVAKPGYAVGQMVLTSSDRLEGFKLVFMRQSGGRLLPGDSYDSPWVGVPLKGEPKTIGDGSPVGGLFGHAGGEIDGAGLILLK